MGCCMEKGHLLGATGIYVQQQVRLVIQTPDEEEGIELVNVTDSDAARLKSRQ